MQTNWASEHLQVIRTLMERSALYRRALGPVMVFNGVLGTLAAGAGWLARVDAPRLFITYWMAVAVVAVAGSFLLTRRQALKDAEPFWSPPARRVGQALLPPLLLGAALGVTVFLRSGPDPAGAAAPLARVWLPLAWVALYGCALHAAGFFMPRGMKVFGLAFVLAGAAFLASGLPEFISLPAMGHGIMGLFFGLAHLAYGAYLHFTEPHTKDA